MGNPLSLRRMLILFCVSLVAISGCASTDPSKFYTLSPLKKLEKEAEKGGTAQSLTIGVGPVLFPEYLKRTEIVTRLGDHSINVSDFNLWAGSLEEDFARVLVENLSILLSTEKIIVLPGPRLLPLDSQVTMDVIRFDGALGGEVQLVARWGIHEGKEKKLVSVQKSSITEAAGGPGYEALVAAQSRALERLSREIAEAIKKLPR